LSRIQAEFGDELSVTDLAGASTISSQARLLREKGNGASAEEQDLKSDLPAQASLLVKLKNAGETGSPRQEASLFLVHPAAGTLTCYQQMVAALEIGGPVYGLRANGLEPGEICGPESLENLASGYCNVIRSVQPDGPYRLCGWSYGGVLAFEMARQLTRDGHKVSFVGLVDSYAPDDLKAFEQAGHDPENAIETTCEKAFLRDLFGADVGVEPGQDVIELARSFPQFELIFPGGTSEDLRRLFAVYSAHYRLVLGYDPDQVDVPLHLVRAKEGTDGDYLEGWAALTRSDVQLHIVDANHFSILDKPNLDSWLPGFCDVMEKG
jgi:thioesterase domain-containing protein